MSYELACEQVYQFKEPYRYNIQQDQFAHVFDDNNKPDGSFKELEDNSNQNNNNNNNDNNNNNSNNNNNNNNSN